MNQHIINSTTMTTTETYDDYNNTAFDYDSYEELCKKHDIRRFAAVFLPAFYSVAFVVGIAGNSLVVAIYAYYKKMKTKSDVYLLNLAVADLLLLFTLPFWAVDASTGWQFGKAMCKITSALYTVNFSSGMQFLACISLDRYFSVLRVSTNQNFRRRCWAICLFVWITSMLLSIPDLQFSEIKEHNGKHACLPSYPKDSVKQLTAFIQILETVCCFVIPFLIMLFCYSAMAKVLVKTPNIKRSRSLKVLLAVVGMFLITQLPYNVIKFWRAIDIVYALITNCQTSRTIDLLMQVTSSMALFHSCLNPLLYAYMGTTFKSYVTKTVKKFGSWRRQRTPSVEEYSMYSDNHVEETSSFSI
ncbi:atypical chemokine receptor 4 [Bufo bufo]|uniref:atypical chemokine receptor 4 n=1 Tax=Bufo bufo TaxID=8384 RepID=UPI001ABEC233|nr:atypical chemokine receptor 4 [Bufo bufo]XP_040289212.1 atypical chemokine receptor 4 [Bufo bufo]